MGSRERSDDIRARKGVFGNVKRCRTPVRAIAIALISDQRFLWLPVTRAGPGLQGRVYKAYILLDNDSGMQPGRRAPSILLSSLISLLTACL